MHTYFKGWRRKTGCVILVAAVIVTGFWARSRETADCLSVYSPARQDIIASLRGQFIWTTRNVESNSEWTWRIKSLPIFSSKIGFPSVEELIVMRLYKTSNDWAVDYWTVVLPLTLLSALLLLWPQRKRSG